MAGRMYRAIATFINLVLVIITFFLGLRIVFELFSANAATPFVSWIYQSSAVLMSPFRGIVSNIPIQTGFLDVTALITLIVYDLAGFVIVNMIRGLIRSAVTYRDNRRVAAHYHDIRRGSNVIDDDDDDLIE